ncbi:M56 family metallopeptidase [Planctomycetota bacterium]|nr:M56 family metallopeptidase [Planctomycetota bacterium]
MMTWLLMFLLHSTVWCGVAAIVLRLRPGMHARMRAMICYTAIVASLVTPTVRGMMSGESAMWQVTLPERVVASGEGEMNERSEATEVDGGLEHALVEGSGLVEEREASAWWMSERTMFVFWFGIAGLLLGRYGVRMWLLKRELKGRGAVEDEQMLGILNRLTKRARFARMPRLTASRKLGSPIAFGVGRGREICVPEHASELLDEEQMTAMLGHEMAHHVRGDTMKLVLLNVLKALLFVQPLVWVIVREIHVADEEQCDDWAADQVDDRLVMASCLTEVAEWVSERGHVSGVACMAGKGSGLKRRVLRLIDEGGLVKRPSWRICVVLSAVLIFGAACFAPAIVVANEGEHGESAAERYVIGTDDQAELMGYIERALMAHTEGDEHEVSEEHEVISEHDAD